MPLLQYLGTIIFSMTRVASQVLGIFLLLKFKRKAVFVTSAVITGLGMALFALATSDLLLKPAPAVLDDHHKNTLVQTLNETNFIELPGNHSKICSYTYVLSNFKRAITEMIKV